MPAPTLMHQEILDIPHAVENLLTQGAPAMGKAAAALVERNPYFMVTIARGSSDHAATYFKYATELLMGIPVASLAPSVASLYRCEVKLAHSACLAVSQSGKSPDIVAMADMAARGGSLTFAATNNPASDLAAVSAHTLGLHAGEERSVAATKTFVASLVVALWLLALWQRNDELLSAIKALPRVLEAARRQNWDTLGEQIAPPQSLYCLGRGASLAIANEAALKFKETCRVHAESYSSAEVLHGPVAIVGNGFPVLALGARDEAEDALAAVADALAAKGARVFTTSQKAKSATLLPVARTAHPLTEPVSIIVSFYAMVERAALLQGINPDAPQHLKKVTETL